jgi:hypothetical protein
MYRRYENRIQILVGKPEAKNNLEDLDVDWRIILEWILEKQDLSGSVQGPVADFCEHCNGGWGISCR